MLAIAQSCRGNLCAPSLGNSHVQSIPRNRDSLRAACSVYNVNARCLGLRAVTGCFEFAGWRRGTTKVKAFAEATENLLPATVITGALGSGKTTLINGILAKPHGKRTAIIQNEFGQLDIDGDLLSMRQNLTASDEQIILLNNGCMCCSVRGDLINMLQSLKKRKHEIDHIVLETTGLAHPAPIIHSFFAEPAVADFVYLDGVVTVVDAKHVVMQLHRRPGAKDSETMMQIAYADRIVLNKTDLVAEEDIGAITSRIRELNKSAIVEKTQQSHVPLDFVLGIGSFDLDRVENQLLRDSQSHDESPNSHDSNHHHGHLHDDAVSSVSISTEDDLDYEKVNLWLEHFITSNSEDIYRVKGILSIRDVSQRYVFQAVHSMYQGTAERAWPEGSPRVSKLVIIGRHLDKDGIRRGLLSCRAA